MALAILCLGLGLCYFGYAIIYTVRQAPVIISELDKVGTRIDRVLDTAGRLGPQLEPVLQQVKSLQQQIPLVLKEVEANRLLLPSVLKQVSMTTAQVPPILAEMQAVRKVLPDVLKELESYRLLVPGLQEELLAYRMMTPKILAETKAVRLMVPQTMDRADSLVANMQLAGKKASEGAVVGVISGILKAPLSLAGSLGKTFQSRGVTDKDIRFIKEAAGSALSKPMGEVSRWNNPPSKHSGLISVISERVVDGRRCRTLEMTIARSGRQIEKRTSELCLTGEDEWKIVEPKIQ